MSERLQHMQQKREQIRRAAQALFLEQGFERATMDAIAAAAHVSKQTLYRYYPHKEQLFADILVSFTQPQMLPSASSREVAFKNQAEFARVLVHCSSIWRHHRLPMMSIGLSKLVMWDPMGSCGS